MGLWTILAKAENELLRCFRKLARSKKLVTAINLPVCMGILLSGWLATTVPVIAGDLDQSPATVHSDTPPCHAKAPPQKKDSCGDEGGICILCPSGLLLELIQNQLWIANEPAYFAFHGSLKSISFRPELRPPISHRLR